VVVVDVPEDLKAIWFGCDNPDAKTPRNSPVCKYSKILLAPKFATNRCWFSGLNVIP
jgi:hypothetical protein